jgi:hypothetical protein
MITRNVILDLMPLYEAGELSADTRALVEAYLKEHPEMTTGAPPDALFKGSAAARPEHERRSALERTRTLLARRQRFFGAALGSTLMPFAFAFEGSRVTWFMLRDATAPALVFLVAASVCWIGYWRASRELRVAGM